MMLRFFILFFTITLRVFGQETIETDICVYGGTAGGVVAAVEAARLGKQTVLLEFGNHLGGMTSGGLGQTDIGNKGAIGGISREFYQRVGAKYGKDEAWTFEPHVAERVLFEMINEAKVAVFFQSHLATVHKSAGHIESITIEDGPIIRAKVFIDATYEGDLMAKAGVSHTVGRESNSKYGETLNGVRAVTPKHQFLVSVDPYHNPGKPDSGLIPLIQPGDGGVPVKLTKLFKPTISVWCSRAIQ
jgi:flavin-dependent dehydrogenase